ncbi:MAG: hypothetical protein H6581_15185 [Bacteroidia bacterium]|nr:hypothetical protein [Bacteroidia bacterium]
MILRFVFGVVVFLGLGGSGAAILQAQVIVDVITGPTCVKAEKVVAQARKQVKVFNRKAGESMRFQVWELPESTPLDLGLVKLNGKRLTEGQKVPERVTGYGSPTVLVNGENAVPTEWKENGFASCAAEIPSPAQLKRLFRKKLAIRLKH